jgi:hypothetical protein
MEGREAERAEGRKEGNKHVYHNVMVNLAF